MCFVAFHLLFAETQGVVPSVVVGVVGIGHVDGIVQNWDKEIDVKQLLRYVDVSVAVSNSLVCVCCFFVWLSVCLFIFCTASFSF